MPPRVQMGPLRFRSFYKSPPHLAILVSIRSRIINPLKSPTSDQKDSFAFHMCPHSLVIDFGIPSFFKCPISLDLMVDPVTLSSGVTYDRSSIERWLDDGHNTCPATMRVLDNHDLTPNHTLLRLIQQWCVFNASHGIQRIPTPKPPAEPRQVQLMLDTITCSSGDGRLAAVRRLGALANESNRNRRCMEAAGVVKVLANLLGSESLGSNPEIAQIMEDTVGILVMFSLDDHSRRELMGTKQLTLMSRFLSEEYMMDTRLGAVQLLEAIAVDRSARLKIGEHYGILQGLIALSRETLCPAAVTASLKTLLTLSQEFKNRIRVVEMDAVSTAVQLLPGADKVRTEKVMALLDVLSACSEGRAALSRHALAIPYVVKSLLAVSDSTSEHAVGILWSICMHSAEDEILHETIQLGTFNKLLLLAQMDGDLRTKQKAKDLLRLIVEFSPACITTTSEEI